MTLRLHGRTVRGPLQLLRRNENGLTFAYGYALDQSRNLLDSLLKRVGLAASLATRAVSIALQERDTEGITDIELSTRDAGPVLVLEAKIGGWPGTAQLSRYARHLRRQGRGKPVLVALGVSPYAPELWRRRSIRGVRLVLLRWADVLSMVNEASHRAQSAEAEILLQLKEFIQEVIGMQSYDREVLVRDVNVAKPSYPLFLEYGLYVCQAAERSEPLLFAPCFTGAKVQVDNGIH